MGDTGKAAGQQDILNFLKLRERQLVLGADPVQGFIPEEGIGGARLEQALGRTINRSPDPAADFIDSKLGPISLKGPLPEKGNVAGLAKSVIEDAMGRNTATRTVVVDTLGLSEQDTSMLKSAIQAGTKGTKKQIIYLH